MKKNLIPICIVATSAASHGALLLGYNTINSTSVTPAVVGSNVSGVDLTRGGGVSATGGGTYNSRGWHDSTDQASAKSNGDYLEFGISVDTGFLLSNLSAGFFGDRSASGPSSIEVFYSTDGFATESSVLAATDVGINGSIRDTTAVGDALTGTVLFRIYGYGATSSSGTFDLEKTKYDGTYGLAINGDVVAVPEPSSAALLGLGGLALILRRRR